MVIIYLYDARNGYRYRHISCSYYNRVQNHPWIVSAWMVHN